eukprot:CAMPEP_0171111582 /NCGR_PEP_ID=MMETSP0766_2-20121228/75632_1 /TAXON_ID=439317 /ORGANISM="Gambierdiscus australes, Strain CAWD 149" /LENGTH=84 /DNA_ID=CAMNT_0011573583 /DNA_START=30 /DNA_END=281 /DNA_ORIENTATION=+
MAPNSLSFLLTLFGMIALAFAVFFIWVWAWGIYVDKHEHDPGRIRAVMFLILALITAIDLGLVADGVFGPGVAWVSLLVNLWGG